MNYKEVHTLSSTHKVLAHVIFANFEVSNKITDNINKKFNLISTLKKNHPNYLETFIASNTIADCLETTINDTKIFSLILGKTSKEYITHSYLVYALDKLKNMCINQNIHEIVICTSGLELLEKYIELPVYMKGKYDRSTNLKTLTIESKIVNTIEYEFYNTDINIIYYEGESYD